MPSLAGAGSPFWYPKARGVIMGITLGTDRQDLARAMMEGITLEAEETPDGLSQLLYNGV